MKIPSVIANPARDVWTGFQRCVDAGPKSALLVIVGLWVGYWLYVPVHELLHAYGCMATGGEVTRLEIDAVYGGALLARFIPWVYSGSEYAGQLTGFDTGGSDLVYLATDMAPFLLTIFPGVWLLLRQGRAGNGFRFGMALPLALAPFFSLHGDAYEIGSILTTNLGPWTDPDVVEVLRGDDLFLQASRVGESELAPWAGWALASAIGTVWAFATYGLGRLFVGRPAPEKQA